MSSPSIHEQVYEKVRESLPPYVPPEPWHRLVGEDDLRQPVADPGVVLETLGKCFSPDDLVQTGVAERLDDPAATLSRSLCGRGAAILVLRGPEGKVPFELVSDAGCLSQRLLPICALLADGRVRRLLARSERPLCVAFSMADAAILFRAGFPSIVATGLSQAKGQDLELFRRCFQLRARGEQTSPAEFLAKKKLWTSPGGKTPDATLYASILRDLRKGKDSRFKKAAPGRFTLARKS